MPNFTGLLKSESFTVTAMSVNDTPGHVLIQVEVKSRQSCSDSRFDNIRHTTCGTVDLINGDGREHGYFVFTFANGDLACGTYEGKVSTRYMVPSAEGTWEFTHGTGEFTGIKGGGKFKGRLTSPTSAKCSFDGTYQLKAESCAA